MTIDALTIVRSLYAFETWTTPRIIAAASKLADGALRKPGVIAGGHGAGSLYETLAHVAGSRTLWLRRWQGEELARLATGDDYPSLRELSEAWLRADGEVGALLATLAADDLARAVRYLSVTRHVMEEFPLLDTALHSANHTTHHRSEACVALTTLGSPPETVDMVDWLRAGSPEAPER